MILLYKRKETKLKEQTLTNFYKRRLIPGKGGVNGKGPTKSEFKSREKGIYKIIKIINSSSSISVRRPPLNKC